MAKLEITPEMISKLVAAAVAEALANKQAERVDAAKAGRSERSIQNEIAAARAFKKAGFTDAQPGVNIKTYNRWAAEGRKVKTGEKAIKVKNLRLFHISQTETVTGDEKAKLLEQQQEAIRRHNAKQAEAKAAKEAPKGLADDEIVALEAYRKAKAAEAAKALAKAQADNHIPE